MIPSSKSNSTYPFMRVQGTLCRFQVVVSDHVLSHYRDVLSQLQSTRPLFSSYLRIRSLTTTATSPELASARSDLESALGALAEDLADLVESVKAVEDDPSRFGLSHAELARRKRVVQEAGGEVENMRSELSKAVQAGGGSRAGRGGAASDLPDPSSFAIADGEAGDDYAAEFEQQQQAQLMRDQDEHLDGVFQTVGNLRRQADDMGRELEEQREMLEVVDELADRVGGRLQTGMDKLKYVIRHNEDRLSSCCIGALIVVLIILLVLLLII